MPILASDVIEWEFEDAELGEQRTNFLKLTKHPNEFKDYCARLLNGEKHRTSEDGQKQYCAHRAGHDTDHVGEGACRRHGGMAGRFSKHGKYAPVNEHRLYNRVVQYAQRDRPQLMDLTFELAATRVLIEEIVQHFPEPDDDNMLEYFSAIDRLQSMVGTVGSLLEKISRVEARSVLTAGEVMLLKAKIEAVLMRYIPDAQMRQLAFLDLENSIPSQQQIEAKTTIIEGK